MLSLTEVIAHDVQTGHRAGRMLEALIASDNKRAKVILTTDLHSASGSQYHQTFAVKAWTHRATGVKMLTVEVEGSGSWAEGTFAIKVLHVNLDSRTITRPRDARNEDKLLRYAADAALAFAWLGEEGLPTPANGTVEVLEASTCGACGRKLTDPVSIDRGIGPECASRATGTRTITSRMAVA